VQTVAHERISRRFVRAPQSVNRTPFKSSQLSGSVALNFNVPVIYGAFCSRTRGVYDCKEIPIPVLVCGRRITHHCYDGTVGARAIHSFIHLLPECRLDNVPNNPCIIGTLLADTNTKQTFPLANTSNSGPCKAANCNFTSPLYQATVMGLPFRPSIPTRSCRVDENVATARVLKSWTLHRLPMQQAGQKAASRLTI